MKYLDRHKIAIDKQTTYENKNLEFGFLELERKREKREERKRRGIKFGTRFNQSVDLLPTGLQIVEFGNYFNQKIDRLPRQLANLQLGLAFSQKTEKFVLNAPKTRIRKFST